jgi:putative tryptophan/tyrosine transport system substrate-binding protein
MGAAYVWPHVAKAQLTAGRRRIGILVGQAASDPEWVARFGALTKGLRELGWEEGNNISFEVRHAVGNPDQFSPMAAELVSAGVDVLVVAPAGLAVIARRATSSCPRAI